MHAMQTTIASTLGSTPVALAFAQDMFLNVPLIADWQAIAGTCEHYVSEKCDNILRGYLYVVTTVLSHQDGIYGFKFPNRFSEISCSCRDLTSLFKALFSFLLN
jgi:hypothetical protein